MLVVRGAPRSEPVTQFGDTRTQFTPETVRASMSEYYLADKRAKERATQGAAQKSSSNSDSQSVKVTLLGDFLFQSAESKGCDPYNSTQGKSLRDAWSTRRGRR